MACANMATDGLCQNAAPNGSPKQDLIPTEVSNNCPTISAPTRPPNRPSNQSPNQILMGSQIRAKVGPQSWSPNGSPSQAHIPTEVSKNYKEIGTTIFKQIPTTPNKIQQFSTSCDFRKRYWLKHYWFRGPRPRWTFPRPVKPKSDTMELCTVLPAREVD